MTFTVAFLLLGIGIMIGYRLPEPIAKLKARYRRYRYKPELLRPYVIKSEKKRRNTEA